MLARHGHYCRIILLHSCPSPRAQPLAPSPAIMASSSSVASAGASTPGIIRLGQYNVGLGQADSFKKDNVIAQHLATLAETLAEMLLEVDMVAINELHAQHHGQVNELLAYYGGVAFIGFITGDAICWRR